MQERMRKLWNDYLPGHGLKIGASKGSKGTWHNSRHFDNKLIEQTHAWSAASDGNAVGTMRIGVRLTQSTGLLATAQGLIVLQDGNMFHLLMDK